MTDDGQTMELNASADRDVGAEDRDVIRAGRNFEEVYHLSSADAGQFMIDVGEQLRAGDELTIETDDWALPFRFGEPVEVEIDFEGVGHPELEIEVELQERGGEAPTVE